MGRRLRGKNRRRSNRNRTGNKTVLKQIEENTRTERPYDPPHIPDKIPMQLAERRITTLKRSTIGTGIAVSTSSSTYGAASYYLASFDTSSEIIENWQMYRIIEITVKFIPLGNIVNVIDETNDAIQDMGVIYTAIDYTNDTTPTTHAELQQYKNCQCVRIGTYFSRTWTPHAAARVYAGVTDAFSVLPSSTWMSSQYNDVNYYGIKWALTQVVGVASSNIYRTEVSAVIQCKDPL